MKEVVLALVLLCIVQYGVAVNQDCPANLPKNDYLLQFGDFCYEFVLNHFGTWHDAEKDCLSRGGFLTDIHSYAENNFILNSLQVLNFVRDKGVWIGLTDEIYEGTWKWASASAFTFSNWAPGQPGVLGGSEDCALLEISDFGHWHDYPCDGNIFGRQSHGWVCKYRTVIRKIHAACASDLTADIDQFLSEVRRWKARCQTSENPTDCLQTALSQINRELYPNVHACFSLLLAMPVSTASAERSFSTMRRVKTYLRSTMTTKRLSGLCLLNIYREREIDSEAVVDTFARRKERRLSLIFNV